MRRDDRRRRWVVTLALVAASIGAPELSAGEAAMMGPPPGQLVDVGGYSLHIYCRGEGAPTVVIDGGAGHWSIFYAHIQASIGDARVCLYDRAGLGWSDPGPKPRTSSRMAEELHTLLHRAGVAPPLVLVGHSLGGYNVRIYQAHYPEEVGALVLVESGHERQWERLPKEVSQLLAAGVQAMRSQAEQARNGKIEPASIDLGVFEKQVPQYRGAYLAAMQAAKTFEARADEIEEGVTSAHQVPAGQSLGELPLIVLTAKHSFDAFRGAPIPIEASNVVWLELQDDLASLSRDATHLFSEHGTHDLPKTDPDAMVSAIHLGVDAARKRSEYPAGLGLPVHALPAASTPVVDKLLQEVELAYNTMDTDRFVALFTEDVSQLDVNRRVHVKGRALWREWTQKINAAHCSMERRHRGRAVVGDWVVAEIEWSGTVHGEALGTPGEDHNYRFTGLGLIRIKDGKIQQQIFYGDYTTLSEQLGTGPTSSAPSQQGE